MEVKPYFKNHKKHPRPQVYKIACSIRDFGWQQPIVVDKEGVVIAGHGRWFAWEWYGKELGLKEPWIKVAEELTPEQVHTYRLADNLVASTDYDMDVVNSELSQIGLAFEPYQAMLSFESIGGTEKTETDEKFVNEEGLLNYLNNTVRQMVLHYDQGVFNELVKKFDELCKHYKLDTTSDLVKMLIEKEHAAINSNA